MWEIHFSWTERVSLSFTDGPLMTMCKDEVLQMMIYKWQSHAIYSIPQSILSDVDLEFRDLAASRKHAYDRNACPDFRRGLAKCVVAQLLPGRFMKKTDTS